MSLGTLGGRTRRTRPASWLAGLTILAGCAGDDPTDPGSDSVVPVASIAPEIGVEQPGFTFLAPIGDYQPNSPAGALDASLLPLLRVEVCEWSGSACVMPLARTFTAKSGLTITDGALAGYRAAWSVTGRPADLGKRYRIRVLMERVELGRADVDVVRRSELPTGGEAAAGSGKVALGSSVPIRFHIAQGTVVRVGPNGGTVSLAGGLVSLDVPAGALAGQPPITAVRADNLPPGGPAIVTGTAWDFGPDGLVFATPVKMTIRYDPASLPPGTVESELRIHKLVNGAYQQQNAGLVDPVNKTVSAQVNGFSVYVVLARIPGMEEDLTPPVVTAVEVFDPASNTWGSAVTLDASAADVTVRFRAAIQDDITGVEQVNFNLVSPGRVNPRNCFVNGPPVSGSDTQGVWECAVVLPRYSEAGVWSLRSLSVSDEVVNARAYVTAPAVVGFCPSPPGPPCLPSAPVITLISNPSDISPPVVSDPVEVSLDVTPRVFGQSVSIDVATGPRTVVVSVPFTDDLAGTDPPTLNPTVRFQPVGGGGPFVFGSFCQRQGTTLAGTFECRVTFQQFAATGTYYLGALTVLDRVGNGAVYSGSPGGPLCEPRSGACISSGPTVDVVSLGDTQAPLLQSLTITVNGADLTTTIDVTDDLAGFAVGSVVYRSATTTQVQHCSLRPTGGPTTAGTVACTITFSQFAARGSWYLGLAVNDAAGNGRSYTRRASDGFLCYTDAATQQQICQDFGDTDLILP